jgi:PadR family transcriptional regulator PadR
MLARLLFRMPYGCAMGTNFSCVNHDKRCKLLSVIDKTDETADLVQGTLGLLILRILALESMHGWAVSQRLKQMSKDVLQVGPGSLYPALHKLEQEGWIAAEWLISDTRRRVKFYSLTKEGRKQLESQTADWKRLSGAISAIVLPIRG